MPSTPRLLPILIVAAALLLSTKLADVYLSIDLTPTTRAVAETKSDAKHDAKAETKPDAKSDAKPDAKSDEHAAADEPAPRRMASNEFTPQEVDVLQTLSKRRAELDKRNGEIDQREALLQATEQRINEKIAKLQEMQQSIADSFKKEDQADDAKLKNLVKVYESMKPKEAARIFEQLDLPVLLDVIERMKDRGTGAILAAMDPAKAKAVTLGLAARQPKPQLKE